MKLKALPTKLLQEVRIELRNQVRSKRPIKLIFDHLPKCGGTSFHNYLEAHYPRKRTFHLKGTGPHQSVQEFRAFSRERRHGFDLVKGHEAHQLLDEVHPDCLAVTVLRDPVDRIISHYAFAKRTPIHYLHAKIHRSGVTLVEFATSSCREFKPLRNWYTTHFTGCSTEPLANHPDLADEAIEVIRRRYDIVGFLDEFSSFADAVRDRAGLRLHYRGDRLNVSTDRPSVDELEKSELEQIEELHRADIRLYKALKADATAAGTLVLDSLTTTHGEPPCSSSGKPSAPQ